MNQAIHTLDLVQWFLGPVARVDSRIGTLALGAYVDVEDTASLVMDHENGSRSVLFATLANAVDSPVTIEVDTERARLLVRGDLLVSYADGRTEVVEERRATPTGRAYCSCWRSGRTGACRTSCSSPTSTRDSTTRNRSGSARPRGWPRWPSSTTSTGSRTGHRHSPNGVRSQQ